MRILIAEDDPPSRRLLKVHLTTGGHEVVEASDGLHAWEMLQREHFRMVITDWMMPNMAGPALIRRIRSELSSGYTYTIIVSALSEKAQLLDGLASGADDYVIKPYYADELLARVKIGERILRLEEGLRQARERMEYQARHDDLTGLLNRRAVQEYADSELNRAARASTPVSILLMDLDHFKSINDHYGHQAGDQALQLFAEILLASIRLYDWVGRWGGEEFLCVLPGATLADARQVAERIRAAMAGSQLPIALPEAQAITLTVSIGVASTAATSDLVKLDKLVRSADAALYRAKNEGRNRICLADSNDSLTWARGLD